MGRELIIPPNIEKQFRRLKKKDRATFKQVMKKVGEICERPTEVGSAKKYHLTGCRGVHVGSFVLIWTVEKASERTAVRIVLFEHHDDAY